MRVSQLLISAVLAGTVSAGWIYPSKYWRSISQTLPGATFRKRNAPPSPARLAERGGSDRDLWQACSTKNLASKYNGYPISGMSAGGSTIDQRYTTIFDYGTYATDSAYDCCVTAQKMSNSSTFYYSSSGISFFGAPPGANCFVMFTSYCQAPRTSVVVFGAIYNGSEPRGTTYGNYIGNGRCGPGFTVAQNVQDGGSCSSSTGVMLNNNTSAATSVSACTYGGAGGFDFGGPMPAG